MSGDCKDMLSRADIDMLMSRRLKRLRELAERSQADVAKLLGVTADAYAKMEQRGRIPAALLPQFALIVKMSTDSVLDVEDENRRPAQPRVAGRPPARQPQKVRAAAKR